MENQIYRVDMESKTCLEFYICGTNEINPYRKTKEIAIQLIIEEKQLDAGLDLNELNSFIDYLIKCKDYITEYNSKSLPIEME
jgi:hypothetical protein